ncbi:MAG TPA: AraC family transcriptional regulator [Gemmatimonadaceae bacterium]|nr:AraC family transcriptional regulator [Gemmatimonadaceae bacterium]
MSDYPVPVSMGSPRFATQSVRGCAVTFVWFPPGAVLEPHVHDRPTLAVILTGGFDLVFANPVFGRTRLECPSGTILTQPAGEKHTNLIGAAGAQGVVLEPDAAAGILPEQCLVPLDSVNHFRDGPIACAARRVALEMAAPDDLTPLAVEGLVLDMLAHAGRLHEDGFAFKEPPAWLRVATETVHERFRESLRIEEIAGVAGVHPAHFACVFRRAHRMPLADYMRRLRVDWAAEQLIVTRRPISWIAAEAGFADQAHLTRWFGRMMGATPAAYRQTRQR